MNYKVPNDPELLVFSENKTVASLQKWRHYAMSLIGLITLREIEKRNLIIVPEDLFFDLLKKHDNEAFNIICDNSIQKDQQVRKR